MVSAVPQATSATHLVLIPSYNPGPRLASTLRAVLEHWSPVWIVDDGSTDGSSRAVQEQMANDPRVHVIVRPSNGGKGAAVATGVDARTRNLQIAMADRQAVFKNNCASCHVAPAVDKKGQALYSAACAICHDAPHRATMVPDLKTVQAEQNKIYWLHWITNGKPGSLMPAFSKSQGGPLTDEQIESLATYLAESFKKSEKSEEVAKVTTPASGQ